MHQDFQKFWSSKKKLNYFDILELPPFPKKPIVVTSRFDSTTFERYFQDPKKPWFKKTARFDKVAPFFPAIRLTHRGNIAKEIMMTHPHEITDAVSATRTFDFRTLPGPRLRWVRCVLQVPSNPRGFCGAAFRWRFTFSLVELFQAVHATNHPKPQSQRPQTLDQAENFTPQN